MKRTLLTASLLSILTFGCGHALMQPPTRNADDATAKKSSSKADATDAEDESAAESQSRSALRQPGDFATYRFSGSYRSSPVIVSYRVTDRSDSSLTMDVTLDADGQQQQFRLRIHDAPGEAGEILSVARLEGGAEQPFGVDTYEALMAKTVAPIELNEAELEREKTTVRVGDRSLSCTQSSYRVVAAGRTATMTVFESPTFAWGDLGGEITAKDGRVIYKAEIVDFGAQSDAESNTVAAQSQDDPFEEWDDLE